MKLPTSKCPREVITAYNTEKNQCRTKRKIKFKKTALNKTVSAKYKKDGYQQQNMRQRQKIISIIDYDVCMTFY